MNLKEKVINCVDTKEKIENLKQEYVEQKRRIVNFLKEQVFSRDYEVKKIQVKVKCSFDAKVPRVQQNIYFVDFKLTEGFNKIEEVIRFSDYTEQEVSFLLRKYTIEEKETGLKIYVREEFNKWAMVPVKFTNFMRQAQKENEFFINYIKYTIKIEDIEFEFTKEYKSEFIKKLK